MDENRTAAAASVKSDAPVKKTSNSGSKKDQKTIGSWVKEIRAEFSKIVWPNRKELLKMTLTVIVTCILFGILITAFDTVFNVIIGLLLDLFR